MRTKRLAAGLSIVCSLSVIFSGTRARGEFGELPPNPVSESTMGAANEIVTYVMFDPAAVQDRLQDGLRFLTLEEMSKRPDATDVADYLRAHPERQAWAQSFVEIIRPASLEYDGSKAQLGEHGGIGVWYAYVARTDKSDPRPRGSQALALGSWFSDRKLVEELQAKGYPAEFAEIELREGESEAVEGRLKSADVEIRARCRLQGAAHEADFGPVPHLQTIWTPRPLSATFEVITFYGHKERECIEADWQMEGPGLLAKAFRNARDPGDKPAPTEFYAGYVLRGALSRR